MKLDFEWFVDRRYRLQKNGDDASDDEENEDQVKLLMQASGCRGLVHQRVDFLSERSPCIHVAKIFHGRDKVAHQLEQAQ